MDTTATQMRRELVKYAKPQKVSLTKLYIFLILNYLFELKPAILHFQGIILNCTLS